MSHQCRTGLELIGPGVVLIDVDPAVEVVYTWNLSYSPVIEMGGNIPCDGRVGDFLSQRAGDVDLAQAFTAAMISLPTMAPSPRILGKPVKKAILGEAGEYVHHTRVRIHCRRMDFE